MPSSGGQTCALDRKSTRLNSSHGSISYAGFCLQKSKRHRGRGECGFHFRSIAPLSVVPRPLPVTGLTEARAGMNTGTAVPLFFFNDTATTEIYTLSLHDALPISHPSIFTSAIVQGLESGEADRDG